MIWCDRILLYCLSSIDFRSKSNITIPALWEKTYNNPRHFNTWDLQWVYCCLINSGLTIVPNRNLVRNIGYGKDATHTLIEKNSTLTNKVLGDLKHPEFIVINSCADRFQFDYLHEGREKRSILFYILNIPKKIYMFLLARRLIFLRTIKRNFKLKTWYFTKVNNAVSYYE